MDLSVMSEIIAQAVKNNAVVIENPDEANPSFTERAKEYLKALEESEEKNRKIRRISLLVRLLIIFFPDLYFGFCSLSWTVVLPLPNLSPKLARLIRILPFERVFL